MHNDDFYETHSLTWNDITGMIKKYWKLVLIVFISGTIGTYLALQLFFTNQYESKAYLLVKVGRENTEVPATVLNGQVLNQGVRIADINSEVQALSSIVLVERLVDEMGPDSFKFELKPPNSIFGYPKYIVKRVARWVKSGYKEFLILANIKKRLTPREAAIVGVAEGIKVEPVKESDVLVLKVRMPDGKLCVEVANRILTYYLEERAKARKVSAGADFFSAQLMENRDRLKGILNERAKIRRDWQLSAADQQRGLLLQELTSIRLQITQNQGEIAQLEKQQTVMASQVANLPEMLPKEKLEQRNPALESIKDRLTILRVDRAKMSSRYQPDSEMLKRMDAEIADLQRSLDSEAPAVAMSTTSEINPVVREFKAGMEQAKVRIAGLVSRNQDLQASASRISADLDRVNRGGDAYDTLEREYQIAERNYVDYAKKQEDARISEELDSQRLPNVAIMSPPEMPIEPIYPRHLFTLAFALPISLLLGIALAALCETMDDRVRDARMLQLEGVGFLGSLQLEAKGASSSGGD
jgi:polysaccharide biosynthesis protein PslE